MKKKIFYPLATIFLLVAITLWGCKKEDKEPEQVQEKPPAEVIVFPEETIAKKMELLKADGTLVFSGLTEAEKPKKGDIICSGIAEGAPLGFLYKVNQVITADGKTTITTEPASLEEAIENGEIKETISITENNIEGVFDKDGNPIDYEKLKSGGVTGRKFSSGISWEVNKEIDDVTFTGNIELGVEFDFNLSIKNWELKECNLLATPKFNGELSASFDKELFGWSKAIELATIKLQPTTIMIGYVPLVITPEIKVLVQVDLSGKVSISAQIFEVGIASPIGIAYDYEQKKWNGIGIDQESDIKKPTFFKQAELSLSGELQLEPRVISKMGFYNTDTGIGIGLGIYAKLNANLPAGINRIDGFNSDPEIELKAGIASIGKAELKIFNKNFGEWERRTKIAEWELWHRKIFPEFSEITLTANDVGSAEVSCYIDKAPLLGFSILKHGFCWVEGKNNPTIDNQKIELGAIESSLWKNSGKIEMKALLQNLKPGTTYTIAPYYESWYGTMYQKKKVFTTGVVPDLVLSKTALTLNVNQTEQVQITAGSGDYDVKSNQPNIATIELTNNHTLIITGKAQGTATLSVRDKQSGQPQTISVTVNAPTQNLVLSKTALTLNVNQTEQVQITAGSGDYAVKSNQPNIATIELTNNHTLTITGKAQGTATLSVRDKQSGQTQTISVTVNAPTQNLVLSKTALTLNVNQAQQVQITAGSGDYAVKSNQPNIATIELTNNHTLIITGKAQGTATLSVRDKQSGQTQTISVSVNAPTQPQVPNGVVIENGVLKKWPCDKIPADGHVVIPDGVTAIGWRAFFRCSSLKSVVIPNSVTSIRSEAFEGCSSLTSVTLPNSVTSIGNSAFNGCSSLISITLPNSVTSIESSAFYDCNSLTSINIPDGVTTIKYNTFKGCSSLTSITLPNSVTSIGDSAFWRCSSLTSITLPNSVTSIGGYAFYDCSSLTSITLPNSVTLIEYNAFSSCSSLTSITLSNSVTAIRNSAFSGCSSLTSINIPNSVTSIGYYAFSGCSSLTSITIPNSVISIGERAFNGCSSLTSITLPNSVTSIERSAFYDCNSLTSINIPDGITTIKSSTFSGCSSLTSINIPNSVTSIGYYAFSGCSSLTSITIPNSVTLIEYNAFSGCSSLTSITIPNNVTNIGSKAFQNCDSLTSLILKRENPITTMSSVLFMNNNYGGFLPSTTTIKVPAGSVDAYKTAAGWREYAHQIVAE
ncbi:leucine-rich repeat protein [Capnocytophaga canimorsus]|uniref:leucine-rich repeat protein n=1 Tax=Capnocytophaga canimorsus TaxID=28188 RepID=UPI0037D1EBD9